MKRWALTICAVICLLLLPFLSYAQSNQGVTSGQSTTPVTFPAGGCTYQWTNSDPSIGLAASGTGNIPSFTAVNNGVNSVTATITATPVPSGFAYITNESSNDVTVINTATHSVVATIPVGSTPWGEGVSPDGTRLYVVNSLENITDPSNTLSGTVSVINTATNTVIATITAGKKPLDLVVSPDGSRVYVTNPNSSSISVIDAGTNTVINTFNCPSPVGIAISPDGKSLYATSVWGGFPALIVIDSSTGAVINSIAANSYATAVVVSPDGTRVYVTLTDKNEVMVVDATDNTLITTIPVGVQPEGLTISPNGQTVYVANLAGKSISVIDALTNTVKTTIPTNAGPYGLSITPDGKEVYAASENPSLVSVINTSTNNIDYTLTPGTDPISIGNFISAGPGCNSAPITFTITVNSDPDAITPVITVTPATGTISACAGTASASPYIQQFTVSGTSLTDIITITAPPGFEISFTPGGPYGSSVTPSEAAGVTFATPLYIRSKSTDPPGNISGNVTLTSPGATTQYVAVSGVVNGTPAVNTVPNQTVNNGAPTTAINFTGTGNTFTWTNNTPSIGLPANGSGNIASFTAINTGATPVIATITVTPSTSGSAYIANSGSNTVSVVNTSTNKITSTITVGSQPFATSLSADGTRLYVANEVSNTVSMINTQTNAVVATIPVGTFPIGVTLSPDGTRAYVSNSQSNSVSVINTTTNTVVNTITVTFPPSGLLVSADGTHLYVTSGFGSSISYINAATGVTDATINVGAAPFAMVRSPDGKTVYVSNINTNTISVIDVATNTVKATFNTGSLPHGLAISPDGTRLYVADYGSDQVEVFNTTTGATVSTIGVGSQTMGVSISPDGSLVYAPGGNQVSVINTSTNSVQNTVTGTNGTSVGNFVTASATCTGSPATFTITVNSGTFPVITTSTVTGTIAGCLGSPSANPNIAQFTVAGTQLTGDLTITPPPGFDISLTAVGGYSPSLVLKQVGGVVISTVIYVRSSASATGNISGNIAISTPGASDTPVPVTGTVYPLPTVNPVPNQTVNNGALTIPVNFTGSGTIFNWTNDNPGLGLPASGTGDIPAFTASYSGTATAIANITVTPTNAAGCTGTPVTFTISVNPPPPGITTVNATGTIAACLGSPSSDPNIEQFTVSGGGLTGDITATAPAGFEISLNAGIGYGSSVTISGASGVVSNVTVYVRSAAAAPAGNISGNVVVSTPGVANVNVAVSGVVNPLPVVNPVPNQTVDNGAQTTTINFTGTGATYIWSNDNPGIGLPASGMGNIPPFTAIYTGTSTSTATITVTPTEPGSAGCEGTPVTFTITVNPPIPPSFSASASLNGLTTIYGTPSASESFTVSGTNMTSPVLITAPAGFEVSSDNIHFGPTATVGSSGTINSAPVYVRLAATTPAGNNYTGAIVLSTSGAADVDVNIPASVVNKAPLTITGDNKTKAQGTPNPALTVTYTGFVNGDGPDQLTTPPVVSTDATTNSPVGAYPITVTGGDSPNYTVSDVAGTLTVSPSLQYVTIPNAFTPNGDGVNDYWNIPELADYPNCIVSIYTRYGNLVFQSRGYGIPWDGTYKGSPVPVGTYYYIIDAHVDGQQPLSGFVAILR